MIKYHIDSENGLKDFAKDYLLFNLILKYLNTKDKKYIENIKVLMKSNEIRQSEEIKLDFNTNTNKDNKSNKLAEPEREFSLWHREIKKLF